MRALIVDGSRAMRDLVRDFLNRARFQVLAAADSRDAMRFLEGVGPVDVALVDWSLPRGEALQFVRAVRSRSEFDPMRVIMVTTGVDANEVIEGVRAGVDECLVRPFTRNMLLEKIAVLRLARE